MRIVVTGSRHWTDTKTVYAVLAGIAAQRGGGRVDLAHGGAIGADMMAETVAKALHWELPTIYRPTEEEGRKYGRTAPLARNGRMLEDFRPNLVIAFRAEGKSNGTDDTIRKARNLGLPVWVIGEVKW